MFKIKGQRSRSQPDVTGAKICPITNNSAGDCSISIKLTTEYDHVTSDRLQTFNVNGSKVKVIACYNLLASKIVKFHEWIASLSLNFAQTIQEHSITRDIHLSLIHI